MPDELPQRPTADDPEGWRTYWKALGMPWRTEPEIDQVRQQFLAARRAITRDVESGIYPFGEVQLSRADVEWLLATHESDGVSGPVVWEDESQRERVGLDLRGADLRGADLSNLPLTRMVGALTVFQEISRDGLYIGNPAKVKLEGARLRNTHLEGVVLRTLDLQGIQLAFAHLDGSTLSDAHLEGANLRGAQLKGAFLTNARLEGANLREAHLEGAVLEGAHLEGATCWEAHFEGARLFEATLSGAILYLAHLEGARLEKAQFAGRNAVPSDHASMYTWWSGKDVLPPANLQNAYFDSGTILRDAEFGTPQHGCVAVAGTRWGGVDLSTARWPADRTLGDELYALDLLVHQGFVRDKIPPLLGEQNAVRANRQFATALRAQGLNEMADGFAYRAQVLQRSVLIRQRQRAKFVGSWLLDLVAGYGYKPERSFATYGVTILVFAVLYWCVTNDVSLTHGVFTHLVTWLGMSPPPRTTQPLQGYEALIVSLTSFHGRGFFQPMQSPGDKVAMLAAIEAAVGLLVEITFIAAFTQRFFSR